MATQTITPAARIRKARAVFTAAHTMARRAIAQSASLRFASYREAFALCLKAAHDEARKGPRRLRIFSTMGWLPSPPLPSWCNPIEADPNAHVPTSDLVSRCSQYGSTVAVTALARRAAA